MVLMERLTDVINTIRKRKRDDNSYMELIVALIIFPFALIVCAIFFAILVLSFIFIISLHTAMDIIDHFKDQK